MGSIKAPGLSDIDILVVVDDDFKSAESKRLSISTMDRRVFLHGPIIIPESLASNLQYIFYASNLQCIFGSECLQEWEGLGPVNRKILASCYLVDFIESRFLQFAEIDYFGVDKRAWLTRIWSTVHSLELYEYAFGCPIPDNIKSLMITVKQTRLDWLNNEYIDDMIFLNALDASLDINNFIFFNSLNFMYGRPCINEVVNVITGLKNIKFSNSMEGRKLYSFKNYKIMGKSFNVFFVAHGPSYLAHLQNYKNIKVNWKVAPEVDEGVKEIKVKRKNLVAQHISWLDLHAPASRSMKGYLGIDVNSRKNFKRNVKTVLTKLLS